MGGDSSSSGSPEYVFSDWVIAEDFSRSIFAAHTDEIFLEIYFNGFYVIYGIDLFDLEVSNNFSVYVRNNTYSFNKNLENNTVSAYHQPIHTGYLYLPFKKIFTGRFILIFTNEMLKLRRIEAWGLFKGETCNYFFFIIDYKII